MQRTIITDPNQIKKDIYDIGLKQGDIVFVTANLGATNYFQKSRSNTIKSWVDIFLDILGPEGTIITAAYTDTFFRFKKDQNICFDRDSFSSAGPLSNALLSFHGSIRSTHPVCSYVGLGKKAYEILSCHTAQSKSYEVLKKIVDLGGKNLMLGTVDNINAPMAMHLSQEELGITLKRPFLWLMQTYFINNDGKRELFSLKDAGGCSRGGINLYGELFRNDAIIGINNIGTAKSILIDGKKSYETILPLIKENPNVTHCGDNNCLTCSYNLLKKPIISIKIIIRGLLKFIFRLDLG